MARRRTGAGGRGTTRAGGLRRWGEWCARHGVIVVVGWLVALVALTVANRSFGGDYSDDFALPSAQSQKGLEVLERHDPAAGGYSSQIVVHDADKALTSLGSQMATAVGDLQKLPHVLSVQNPLTAPLRPPAPRRRARRTSRTRARCPRTAAPATSPSASTSSPPVWATATCTESTTPSSRCVRRAPRSSTAVRSGNWPGPTPTTG